MQPIDHYLNPAAATVLVVLILAALVLALAFGIPAQRERHRQRRAAEGIIEQRGRALVLHDDEE